VYRLSDDIPSLSLFSFRKDSAGGTGLQQRAAIGSVVSRAVFRLNEDIATVKLNGESVFVTDSKTFSGADATMQAGLSAFPTEPASPVVNGPILKGFHGRFTLNGSSVAKLNDTTIAIDTQNDLPKNYFGTDYPQAPEGDARNVSLAFNLDDDDTAPTQALFQASLDYTSLDGWFQIGQNAGSIVVIVMKGIQLALPKLDDTSSRRWQKRFAESMSHGSSLTALNEIAIWMC